MSNSPKSEGRLFLNRDKTSDKHPTYKGFIEVTADQLRQLQDMQRNRIEMKIQVAAWPRVAKTSGDRYVYLSAETFVPSEGSGGGRSNKEFPEDDIPF